MTVSIRSDIKRQVPTRRRVRRHEVESRSGFGAPSDQESV